ncbi:MAG TPA: regulatory iron-sulfur-containing complex subunit RicT [Spirochaetota bacterium]|nr:regulatory iron-sulfur-containing complex subunit RicT [Spirochaetota bacterium]HPI88760.1 regulatory iron-sulfur-containing complex subunit RicT [Spirochaetota bacterium]HPR47165.1 regulatory iron-sulfur-containing complex subunit RicT [Spirochaetota bacterium]
MEISAIRLRNSYQIYYIDTNNLFLNQNSLGIVETEHGVDIGNVLKCKSYQGNPSIEVKGKLIRQATEQDLSQIPQIENIEKKAFEKCREKAKAKNLDMKLISVKCLFDKTKIIFYFVAENRIDFRELVRELASVFRTRIEMRQIGVRDEARLIGGYGPCGKQLCCVHQSQEFDPVSIKMAKEQNLNLNSLKISGMCGRLLCCLSYEYETYKDLNKNMPLPGAEVVVGQAVYTVCSVDTMREMLQIKTRDRFVNVSKHDLVKKGDSYTLSEETLQRISRADDDAAEDDGPATFN